MKGACVSENCSVLFCLWVSILQKRFLIKVKIMVAANARVAPAMQAAMQGFARWTRLVASDRKILKLPYTTEHLLAHIT